MSEDASEFDQIITGEPDLQQLEEILDIPTPPWKDAAVKISLSGQTPMTDAMQQCLPKIERARVDDPLFEDMLKELQSEVIEKIQGKDAYIRSYTMMGNDINEICISLAADIIRFMPHPRDAEELQQRHDSPEERAAILSRRDKTLAVYQEASAQRVSILPQDEADQRIAHARIALDPDKRAAARKHVLGVVYGERYVAHLQSQKK